MPKDKKLSWSPSAEVLWAGEVPEDFRIQVVELVGRALSDDEWQQFCRAVFAFSLQLNHEYQVESVAKQKAAIKVASERARALIEALQSLNRPSLGYAFTNLIDNTWESITGRIAAAERMEGRARESLSGTLVLHGIDENLAEDITSELFADWYTSGFLYHPKLAADFNVDLHEVAEALGAAALAPVDSQQSGDAFCVLVGRIDEWADNCRPSIRLSGTKKTEYGNHGKLTYLVKKVLALVPVLYEGDGTRRQKQMREPLVEDSTLADRVLKARARYRAGKMGGK